MNAQTLSRRGPVRRAAILGAALLGAGFATIAPAGAQTPTATPPGLSMAPFQTAYATSFYGFDACGDQVAGRMFRDALNEKIAHCPFTPEARVNFRQWAARQRRVSAGAMSRLVDQTGGLPVKLDGMTTTCHEQRESPEYVAVRTKLEQYARGEIGVDAILPQPCDAAAISP